MRAQTPQLLDTTPRPCRIKQHGIDRCIQRLYDEEKCGVEVIGNEDRCIGCVLCGPSVDRAMDDGVWLGPCDLFCDGKADKRRGNVLERILSVFGADLFTGMRLRGLLCGQRIFGTAGAGPVLRFGGGDQPGDGVREGQSVCACGNRNCLVDHAIQTDENAASHAFGRQR